MNARMMETELPDHGEISPVVPVTAETDFEPVAGKIGDEDAEQVEPTADQPVEKETESTALVAVEKPAEPTQEISEERFWKEIDLLGQLAEAERECQRLEGQYSVYKNEIKDLKEELKVAEMRVRKVSCEILDMLDGRDLPTKPELPAAADATSMDEPEDNGWRLLSTQELLSGIKGIGSKKIDALIAVAPTVGDLEDLRGEASKSHQSFREVLPDGFGQKAADAIEDRLIDHIAKFGSAMKVEPRVESVDLEWIEKTRAQLAEEAKETLDFGADRSSFAPNQDDEQTFIDGFDAYRNKRPITEAPSKEADPIGEWIRGWIYAEIHENWKDAPADAVDDL